MNVLWDSYVLEQELWTRASGAAVSASLSQGTATLRLLCTAHAVSTNDRQKRCSHCPVMLTPSPNIFLYTCACMYACPNLVMDTLGPCT